MNRAHFNLGSVLLLQILEQNDMVYTVLFQISFGSPHPLHDCRLAGSRNTDLYGWRESSDLVMIHPR